MPAIPDSVTGSTTRADWALYHYLDSMDWQSTTLTTDEALEQIWANFLYILPYGSSDGQQRAISKYISEIPARLVAQHYDLANLYLYSRSSPMRNETLYIESLRHLSEKQGIDDDTRALFRSSYDYLHVAAPGEKIDESLRGVLKPGYNLIVIKRDDCHLCHELLHDLATLPSWLRLQRDGRVNIVTIDDTDDIDLLLPHTSTPGLYLVNGDGTVISRDHTLDEALMLLEESK